MINNNRTSSSSSKMEDIRQILLRNPELPYYGIDIVVFYA